MSSKKSIQWLYDELDGLVAGSVIDEGTAHRIREHYGPVKVRSRSDLAILVFSVVGAALIGLGIILVLASNWDVMNRPLRAVISILPMIVGQLVCGWVLWSRGDSMPHREASSTFLMLAVAAGIALIGQTYHIPGNLASFLLSWSLLTLPLVYIMNAAVPAVSFVAMITAWAGYTQVEGGHAAFFYLFALGIVPFIWMNVRQDAGTPRAKLLLWSVALAPCVANGVVLEKAMPGLWLLVYMAYFTMIYLMDATWLRQEGGTGRRPFFTVGWCGIAVLSLMFTFEWPWRQIGWRYYRYGSQYVEWAGAFDFVLLLGFLVPAVALLVRAGGRREYRLLTVGIAPILTIVGWSAAATIDGELIPLVVFNLYVFCLAVITIGAGVGSNKLGTVNVGLMLLFFLIMFRFFDADMGFVVRGVAFILLGIGFLSTNLILNRRFKEAA